MRQRKRIGTAALLILCASAVLCQKRFEPLSLRQVLDTWEGHVASSSGLVKWELGQLCSNYSLPEADCGGPCEYPLFEFTSPNYDPVAHPTVLIIGGFHGDETLGPWIVSYAYPYLNETGRHLLFFPVANPSGFAHGRREEYPSGIDPNRDFPFDSDPSSCLRGITSRLMDYIYRRWSIDLTLTVHQGVKIQEAESINEHKNTDTKPQGDDGQHRKTIEIINKQEDSTLSLPAKKERNAMERISIQRKDFSGSVSWDWVSPLFLQRRKKVEDSAQTTIGRRIASAAGWNSDEAIQMMPLSTGTSHLANIRGSFEDWAYAASWASNFISKCDAFSYEPYPLQMTTGLVFLFEASSRLDLPSSTLGSEAGVYHSNSTDHSNGYISRGVRVLREFLDAGYPRLQLEANHTDCRLKFLVRGCESVKLSIETERQVYRSYLNGSLSPSPNASYFEWAHADPEGKGVALINYEFVCDKEWLDLGKSRFGKGRIFRGQLQIRSRNCSRKGAETEEHMSSSLSWWGLLGAALLVILTFLGCKVYGSCRKKPSELRLQETEEAIGWSMPTEMSLHRPSNDSSGSD